MKRSFAAIITVCFFNPGACALFPVIAPTDLKVDSVSVVDTKSLAASEQEDIRRYKLNALPRKVLSVRFVSNSNLAEVRKSWNDTYLQTAPCRDWQEVGKIVQDSTGGYVPVGPLGVGTSDVYWNETNILIRNPENGPKGTGPFIYHFYIDISRKNDRAGYDLSTKAEDICFRIISAEMLRQGAKTNVVIIPKETIAATLRN